MSNQLKKKISAGGGLYIALAICILSVICIGVYSAVINILDLNSTVNRRAEEKKNDYNQSPSIIIESSTPAPKTTLPPTTSANASVGAEKDEPDVNVQAQPSAPSYSMPVEGNITKQFSNDILVYSETMNDYRVHNGIDIATTVGNSIKAFSGGTVEAIYDDPLLGYTVVLDHGNGVKSRYSNLNPELPEGIETGKTVTEGQVIGCLGETILIECAEESHLHFEVVVNGEYADPLSYLEQ